MTEQISQRGPKLSMLMVLLVFVLPVVVAKLALDNEWFNRASTNKGQLIDPQLDLSALLSETSPKWRILYTLPAHCDQRCENALYSIHQVWLALGPEAERAQPVVLVTQRSDAAASAKLQAAESMEVLQVNGEVVDQTFGQFNESDIYLVDTLNQAMLHYPVLNDPEATVLASRDILADVRKLLKLSHIG